MAKFVRTSYMDVPFAEFSVSPGLFHLAFLRKNNPDYPQPPIRMNYITVTPLTQFNPGAQQHQTQSNPIRQIFQKMVSRQILTKSRQFLRKKILWKNSVLFRRRFHAFL